jgi:hypothetical protein
MSFNNAGRLITKTITTLHHFATLHHTSPSYASLHLSTFHFLSFTLYFPLIWLNPEATIEAAFEAAIEADIEAAIEADIEADIEAAIEDDIEAAIEADI